MGSDDRAGRLWVWHPQPAKDEGCLDLQEDWKRPRVPVAAWAREAGETVRYLGIEVDDALALSEQL